jgi:RimJ/RimL family protein N-acetyltransferase
MLAPILASMTECRMEAVSLTLRPLTGDDVAAIRQWPPDPPAFSLLDFALRAGGWLDQFPESARAHRYGGWSGTLLVGFSLLADIVDADAEFYLALHPDHLGKGLGELITRQTVLIGFNSLSLSRIHLKVRDWHERAIAVYERVGFKPVRHPYCSHPGSTGPLHHHGDFPERDSWLEFGLSRCCAMRGDPPLREAASIIPIFQTLVAHPPAGSHRFLAPMFAAENAW